MVDKCGCDCGEGCCCKKSHDKLTGVFNKFKDMDCANNKKTLKSLYCVYCNSEYFYDGNAYDDMSNKFVCPTCLLKQKIEVEEK